MFRKREKNLQEQNNLRRRLGGEQETRIRRAHEEGQRTFCIYLRRKLD